MKNLGKFIFCALSSLACASQKPSIDPIVKDADAVWQINEIFEEGKKNYGNSYVICYFHGNMSTNSKIFGKDEAVWDGESKAVWYGSSPYNADSIVLTDVINVNGIGSASFSGGYPSGVSLSISSSSRSASYSYSQNNCWTLTVNYSYSANMLSCTSIGQKETATFKFGSVFVVVDSEANNTYRSISSRTVW